jgi:hypothetical protein
MEILIVGILFFGLVGVMAATARGWNQAVGFLAGAILGPFSVLLFFVSGVAKAPKAEPSKVCGQCAEHVKAEAKVCRYCGAAFKW